MSETCDDEARSLAALGVSLCFSTAVCIVLTDSSPKERFGYFIALDKVTRHAPSEREGINRNNISTVKKYQARLEVIIHRSLEKIYTTKKTPLKASFYCSVQINPYTSELP